MVCDEAFVSFDVHSPRRHFLRVQSVCRLIQSLLQERQEPSALALSGAAFAFARLLTNSCVSTSLSPP